MHTESGSGSQAAYVGALGSIKAVSNGVGDRCRGMAPSVHMAASDVSPLWPVAAVCRASAPGRALVAAMPTTRRVTREKSILDAWAVFHTHAADQPLLADSWT